MLDVCGGQGGPRIRKSAGDLDGWFPWVFTLARVEIEKMSKYQLAIQAVHWCAVSHQVAACDRVLVCFQSRQERMGILEVADG